MCDIGQTNSDLTFVLRTTTKHPGLVSPGLQSRSDPSGRSNPGRSEDIIYQLPVFSVPPHQIRQVQASHRSDQPIRPKTRVFLQTWTCIHPSTGTTSTAGSLTCAGKPYYSGQAGQWIPHRYWKSDSIKLALTPSSAVFSWKRFQYKRFQLLKRQYFKKSQADSSLDIFLVLLVSGR